MAHGVRLTLAYDGTEFAGFQRQPDARTIQSELEAAIAIIAQHPVVVRAAGRTDAGVHAEAQIVAFDTTRELEPRRWLLALNRYLPEDAAVRDVCACEPGYHPRFDAIDKTYRYLFHLGLGRDPLLRHRAWQLARSGARPKGPTDLVQLDMPAIQAASAMLLGTHHFGAFRATDDRRTNTQRTLHRVDWIPNWNGHSELLALEVQGSAFMKNMVRIIAGTLIAVGRGRMTPARVGELLAPDATRDRQSETAPAHGLTLVRVRLGRIRSA